jgi:toxin ParE1/3/4
MKFSLSGDAEKDLLEITAYLAEDSPRIALEFFDEFSAACQHLAEMPEMAQRVPEYISQAAPILAGCRRWPLKRFRDYLIFYKPEKDHLLVLRIINGRRDLPTLFGEWNY